MITQQQYDELKAERDALAREVDEANERVGEVTAERDALATKVEVSQHIIKDLKSANQLAGKCLTEIRASVLDELATELEELGPNIGVNYQFVAQRADRVRQGGE